MNVIAQTVPIEQDIGDFCGWLRQQGIPHRVSEHRGQQVIRVRSAEDAQLVQRLYQRLQRGDLQVERTVSPDAHPGVGTALSQAFRAVPVTLWLIIFSVAGALLVFMDRDFDALVWLTFTDPRYVGDGWPPLNQLWRFVSPIFLHFGALHICFNALWLWELGRRIEMLQGGRRLLWLTLLVGVISNAAQAQVTGGVIFGGMSGVIYGLLGYCVLWSRLQPQQSFEINRGVVIFMIAWLILCFAGLSRLIAGVDTANTAHLSGLIAGAIAGVAAGFLAPRR